MHAIARRQFRGRSATGFLGAASAWATPWTVAANAVTDMWDEAPPIYRYRVNAALCSAEKQDGRGCLKGFALRSGFTRCSISLAEISMDDGNSWMSGTPGKEVSDFCSRLWSATVTIENSETTICVPATDSLGNTMPETVPWNPKGYLYNASHRVPAKQLNI